MADVQIRQGMNLGEITGVLSEKNLQLITDTVKGNDGKEIACETIRGSIALDTGEDNLVTINIYNKSKTKSGNDNKKFAGFKTIMTEAVSEKEKAVGKISFKTGIAKMELDKMPVTEIEIPSTVTEPNKLTCKVSLGVQDYFNAQKNELITKVEPSLNKVNRVSSETPNKAVIAVEGVVLGIKDEYVNEEETGRKILDFVHIGYQGAVTPITAIVTEKYAEKFADNFPVGTSCELSFEFTSRRVGGEKTDDADVFMGEVAEVISGYNVSELVFIGAKRPFDEDKVDKDGMRMKYTREEVQKVLNERKIMLETKESEGKEKAKKPTASAGSIASKKQAVSDTQAQSNVNAWF